MYEKKYEIFKNEFLIITRKYFKHLKTKFTTKEYIDFLILYANYSCEYFTKLYGERKFRMWIQKYFLPKSATKFIRRSILGFGPKKNCWEKK